MKKKYYTKTHEWIEVGEDLEVLLGITEYAVSQMGGLTFIDAPEVDTDLSKGNAAFELESVKAMAEVYSPINGTVSDVNEEALSDADIINNDAEGTYILKLKASNLEKDLMDLLTKEEYLKLIEE